MIDNRISTSNLSSSELAAVLRQMADCVEINDSYEGCIEYTGVGEGYEVSGIYRYGNSEGQGYSLLIGTIKE